MAMILPKGIIVNSPQIEGQFEQLDAQPVGDADLARLWRVYTTTQRRLKDPTAERLENLWWRIWGSQGKQLKGAIVARLFAQISDGETFVPLRGPPNRDEGPSLNTRIRLGPGASSTTALHQPNRSKPGTESSSSSKNNAPMPHPILKKTRGPSATGPRPTARFISPHDTEDENVEEDSSSVGTNAHVMVEPPSPVDPQNPKAEKKLAGLSIKKKGGFVAATKKKRPVVSRRQSSQTSQSSTDSPSKYSVIQSSSERTPPTFAAQSRMKTESRLQENFSPSSGQLLGNAQSPKKRNMSRASDSKRAGVSPRKAVSASRKEKASTSEEAAKPGPSSGDPGPSSVLRRAENKQELDPDSLVDPATLTEGELQEVEMQRILLEKANARLERPNQMAAQLIRQSNAPTSMNPMRSASDSHGLLSQERNNKSSASLAPTLTAAVGQINMGDTPREGLQQTSRSASAGRLDKGKGRDPEELQRTRMFAKRQVKSPTPASVPNDSGMLSRSKSQLTLLLENDRARNGESKPPNSRCE